MRCLRSVVPAVLVPALSVAAPTSTRSIEYAPRFDLPIPIP
jgi:hypothetical protein